VLDVPEFAIARFPATCGEYRALLDGIAANGLVLHPHRNAGPRAVTQMDVVNTGLGFRLAKDLG